MQALKIGEDMMKQASSIKKMMLDNIWTTVKGRTRFGTVSQTIVPAFLPHFSISTWAEDGKVTMFISRRDVFSSKEEAEAAAAEISERSFNPIMNKGAPLHFMVTVFSRF